MLLGRGRRRALQLAAKREAELRVTRRTLQVVRAERDRAHTLLRAIRALDVLPPEWVRAVNAAVALESEGDIADAKAGADALAAQVSR